MRAAGLARLTFALALIAILELACRSGRISPLTFIAPSEMVMQMLGLFGRQDTWTLLAFTLANVAAAITASIAVGLVAAFLVHRRRRLREALDPFLASYYAVPFFVLYPIFVAILGLNRWPLILIGFVFAVPGMFTAMLDGLDGVPRILFKIARMHRMNETETALRLVLPAVAPAAFIGIKLTIAYSFIGIIAGEFILADRGLGFAIADAYNRFDTKTMYGLMLIVLTLVIVVNSSVRMMEQRLRRRWERA